MNTFSLPSLLAVATMAILFGALILSLWRLILGPTLADRIVALDVVGFTVAGVMVAVAFFSKQPVLLDAVLVFALLVFFGTVAFGRYLEKRLTDDD